MSRDYSWRGLCVSTERDSYGRGLWRLGRLSFHFSQIAAMIPAASKIPVSTPSKISIRIISSLTLPPLNEQDAMLMNASKTTPVPQARKKNSEVFMELDAIFFLLEV